MIATTPTKALHRAESVAAAYGGAFKIDGMAFQGDSDTIPRPFDISELAENQITLTYCHTFRQAVTSFGASDLSVSLSGKSGEIVVALRTNAITGEKDLVADTAADGVTHDESSPEDGYYRRPLWLLYRAGATGAWQILCALRDMPATGEYD